MNRRWVLAAIVAAGLGLTAIPFVRDGGAGLFGGAEAAPASCDPNAKPAPMEFVLKDMHGKNVNLADYRGKVVLLNFWATWCPPCKAEIPGFVELQEKYRDKGVQFLGLSVDDPVDKLKAFASEYKVNYPLLVGLERDDFQDAYGPMWGIPVTFMISRDGKICRKHMGLASKEQFERELLKLL